MRRLLFLVLLLSLVPSLALARHHYGPPPAYAYSDPYVHHHHHVERHDYRDAWIPVAIVGGLLGVYALSQMDSVYTRPAPQERLCRDSFDHYDAAGRYTHTTYIDRPCN